MSEKKRWKVLRFVGYAIPILLVIYVLSVGPVYAKVLNSCLMARHTHELVESDSIFSNMNIESFYAPLFWTAENNQFIGELLFDYQYFCFEIIYLD
ncbi:hypothetical protein V144x_17510 [Gimesia aquarii]|uniref:Uncharacterized protein n=1 Tax=Gimesia aquarii TaxID=2527964 RepID=A0A517VTF7_9PLAN|nr:hypothetical protein V144x_17510 [Gimesia aquarii]